MPRLELLEAPATDPVTLAETKLRLRVDISADDSGISRLIASASAHAEKICRRAFVTQRWALVLDAFPRDCFIDLPLPPLASVESITYIDADGASQTMAPAAYMVDKLGIVGRVFLAYGESWPVTRAQPMAVRIEFTCGYGNAAAVPAPIVSAILLTVAHLDQNREAVITGTIVAELPLGVNALLSPYVVPGVA